MTPYLLPLRNLKFIYPWTDSGLALLETIQTDIDKVGRLRLAEQIENDAVKLNWHRLKKPRTFTHTINHYTAVQDAYIITHYGKISIGEFAITLNRTKTGIMGHIRYMRKKGKLIPDRFDVDVIKKELEISSIIEVAAKFNLHPVTVKKIKYGCYYLGKKRAARIAGL